MDRMVDDLIYNSDCREFELLGNLSWAELAAKYSRMYALDQSHEWRRFYCKYTLTLVIVAHNWKTFIYKHLFLQHQKHFRTKAMSTNWNQHKFK